MSAFLLAAHPAIGHTQALRAIGRTLLSRGHAVRFALPALSPLPAWVPAPQALRASESVIEGVARDGFVPVPLPARLVHGYYAWRISRSRGYDELDWALRLFMDDAPRVARVLARELRARPASLVVGDCFHYGSALGAELAGVPFVPIFHSGLPFPIPGGAPFGSPLEPDPRVDAQARLDALLVNTQRAIGAARAALGLPPAEARIVERPYGEALNVLTTFEAFEEPRPDLDAKGPVLWAGPCLGTRPEVPFPWAEFEGEGPKVYVSLGTVFNDQPAIYRALIEGVHALGPSARAIVSGGASYDALKAVVRKGDILVKFAPQLELLGKVHVAIVHGGNNSTNEALRAGTPLLVVPFGGEQVANARRAMKVAGAQALDARSVSAARVTEALRRLLTPEARERSRALAASVPSEDGVPRVVAALEALTQ